MKTESVLIVVILLSAVAPCRCEHDRPEADPYYDTGGFSYKVSTESDNAQTWFNRGLAMCFGFNHEEAVRCFERALAEDPSLAMALWGMAYALGPNINNMEIPPHQIAQAAFASRLAELQVGGATALERGLVGALAKRYAAPAPEDRAPLNMAYAEAMRRVHAEHPTDPTVSALFAESLMNLEPWKHWNASGEQGAHTEEILEVLEAGLKTAPNHPFLCHLYIHAVEASPMPERALAAANRLRKAAPGLGHLVHMPSHIYVRLGDYGNVIEANQEAIAADSEFVRREGGHNFYTFYRMHNYHFVVYGAMFDGQKELALQMARELVRQPPEDLLREQVDFLDGLMATPLHVLVRFGAWEDVLTEPAPADYLPVTRALWHYARAVAYAATDRIAAAEVEQKLFAEAQQKVPETSRVFQNTSTDVLRVAEAMMHGEIAYRKQEFESAFEHLREAARRYDALNYDEPWGWMQPTRHALGALLLERGRYEESEAVYRADLKHHPNNPWALHGLAESLEKQGKTRAAAECKARFQDAARRADVDIDRSCYCRLKDQGGD
jgi:tetratricopeptide (TPR) repeat protein